MDFATAVAAVIADTRSPANKEALIRRKINATVRLVTAFARFPQDLYEVIYTPADDPPTMVADSYTQSLPLPELTRIPAYVKDPARDDDNIVIPILDYGAVLDNPKRADIAYQAGNVLQVKLSVIPTSLKLGVFRYLPDLVADTDTNWLMEAVGELIVDYTVAWVFNQIGEDKLSNKISALNATHLRTHVLDRINQHYGML